MVSKYQNKRYSYPKLKDKDTLIKSIDKSLSEAKKKFDILKDHYISTPTEQSQSDKAKTKKRD